MLQLFKSPRAGKRDYSYAAVLAGKIAVGQLSGLDFILQILDF